MEIVKQCNFYCLNFQLKYVQQIPFTTSDSINKNLLVKSCARGELF